MALQFEIVRVIPKRWGEKWQRFNVFHDGELLVERSKDPEWDACRAYLALHPEAADERAVFIHGTNAGICVRLGHGATLRTVESETRDLHLRKWKPYDRKDNSEEADEDAA
jgi:hypothetical protein